MTKLTPARKALLRTLNRAEEAVSHKKLTPRERIASIAALQEGLVTWGIDGRKLSITDAGRAALMEAGK